MAPKTMFEKIWESHLVHEEEGQSSVIYIDLHLVHEVTCLLYTSPSPRD